MCVSLLPSQCAEQHGRVGCLVRLVNSTPLSFRAAFVQLAFWREFKLYTIRFYTFRHRDMQQQQHTHRNPSPRSDITPHHWFLPNLQPPPWEITQSVQPLGREIHTPGKQPRWVEGLGSRGGEGPRGGEYRVWVCEVWTWKMRGELIEKNARSNVCAPVLEGADRVLIGGFGWREMELKKD